MSGATRAGCVTSFDSSARRSKLPKLTIERLDLAGKRVFLRADLNAPVARGRLGDETRLRAAAHRAHASIVAITRHLQPAAAGLLMQQELSALGRILESPERPLVAILGGAKVSDKLALVEHLLERVDALLIGGGMAFTFLLALGH